MNANFAEYVTEEEKEYYIQNYLDEYEPKEFKKILYGLLNYKEKERVVDLEKDIEHFRSNSEKELGDFMDLVDMQQAKGELQEFEEDRMEAYHDYV